MNQIIIKNATIVNEGETYRGSIILENGIIQSVLNGEYTETPPSDAQIIDGQGKLLIPGVIDDQVHFREPGLTHKGEIYTESRAAVAGGVTSYMEMPNTNPQATNLEILEKKFDRAREVSLANYSFYLGATNDNIGQLLKADPKTICGIKVFMGSSTGNMLVDKEETLAEIFKNSKLLIATHCEDEATIQANSNSYHEKYGEDVPIRCHPEIRSAEACYKSSAYAVELAKKYGTRLHVLHISTAREMELFETGWSKDKKITCEVCVHHLWFSDEDYDQYGTLIKWNPAVKSAHDRAILMDSLLEDRIDVIATDHAPHTLEEKKNSYFKAPSGGPLVQHSLIAMLELAAHGVISYVKVVEKMCHRPADLFAVEKRGYIREGYWADLVLIDPDKTWTVNKDNIHYKCGWSPFEGQLFSHQVTHTFVNGTLVYENSGTETERFYEEKKGMRLLFNR